MAGTQARLARIKSAALDVVVTCERIERGADEMDTRILLEAARDAYSDALELDNETLVSRVLAEVAA